MNIECSKYVSPSLAETVAVAGTAAGRGAVAPLQTVPSVPGLLACPRDDAGATTAARNETVSKGSPSVGPVGSRDVSREDDAGCPLCARFDQSNEIVPLMERVDVNVRETVSVDMTAGYPDVGNIPRMGYII